MKARTKYLITLADIDVQSNQPEIVISMTNGLNTLKAVTVNQNVWETIGFLACELVTAPAPVRDRVIRGPVDLMELFRFSIDTDLRLKMAKQYQEFGESDIVSMNEDIINGFDEVNGNNAVSQSIGVANLTVGLSSGKYRLDAETSVAVPDPIPELLRIMFQQDPKNHEVQGLTVIEGKDKKTGLHIEFNVVFAVGNVFVEGRIGSRHHVRIFKGETIELYSKFMDDFSSHPYTFPADDPDFLSAYLNGAAEGIEINQRHS